MGDSVPETPYTVAVKCSRSMLRRILTCPASSEPPSAWRLLLDGVLRRRNSALQLLAPRAVAATHRNKRPSAKRPAGCMAFASSALGGRSAFRRASSAPGRRLGITARGIVRRFGRSRAAPIELMARRLRDGKWHGIVRVGACRERALPDVVVRRRGSNAWRASSAGTGNARCSYVGVGLVRSISDEQCRGEKPGATRVGRKNHQVVWREAAWRCRVRGVLTAQYSSAHRRRPVIIGGGGKH